MNPTTTESTVEYLSRWKILASVMVGSIMGPLDASIVYISLPTIAQEFNVPPDSVGWVSMAYLLIMGSFLLSFGRLGDMLGFKRIYLLGLAVFTLASAACSLAGSLPVLIAARAFQAVGAGLSLSMTTAIITNSFPPSERGRALGINGMLVAVGLAMGPSLGGFLVELSGWRSIFLVNLPIGLAAFILTLKILPAVRGVSGSFFDWPGSLLGFGSLLTLLLFASQGQSAGWSAGIWVMGFLAVALALWFIRWEARAPQPILDLELFGHRTFSAGNAASLMNFVTQYIIVFLTPFLLQQGLGLKPGTTGAYMTAFPLTVLVIAPLAGTLSDRLGQRGLAFIGSLCCTAAALGLVLFSFKVQPYQVSICLGLFGLGTGLFQSPNTSAVMSAVPKHRLGIASGVQATTRNVGMVFGIALGGAVFASRQAAYIYQGGPSPFLSAIQDAYLSAAVVSAAATLMLIFLREKNS
ncbi:MAG: MFS transporter [Firmicutes bacterium]|nr:MFS transporter [Bacillota bacterium]